MWPPGAGDAQPSSKSSSPRHARWRRSRRSAQLLLPRTLNDRLPAQHHPAPSALGGDDFLASLLAIETPALPPAPPAADISDDDLGLNIDMAPFSFETRATSRTQQIRRPLRPQPMSASRP